MDLGLKGKNCVVLGASRGIGEAIARGLAAEGANVAICARDAVVLETVAAALRDRGVQVFASACDVADAGALGAFLDGAKSTLGSIDVLVHNASALAVTPDLAAWEASLAVDLMPAVRAVERVLPWMQAGGGGSIVFIASISGLEASPMPDYAYSTIKAGMIAYAKKLATLQATHGIRVNAIAPGSTEFPGGIWDGIRQSQPGFYNAVRAGIPFQRLGTPQEVADVAVFLASPRAGWVTGECVAVDGGQHRGNR